MGGLPARTCVRLRWSADGPDYTACMEEMEHKKPIRLSGKIIFTMIAVIAGTLALGVGMCLTMVWGRMIAGTATGLVGILILICLIPLTKGIKE